LALEPNPRRFVLWAVALVLPLVLSAVALPYLKGWAGATRVTAAAVAATAAGARLTGAAPGAAPGPDDGAGTPTPPRRDGPTIGEIEAARAAEEALARTRRGWEKVEVMAPRDARVGADGERVAPFHGFGLSVDSSPPGARVLVGGQDMGLTPLLTSVDCRPGEAVEVRLEAKAFRPQARTVRCRADALVWLTFKLPR
jgi:hypothetical protein